MIIKKLSPLEAQKVAAGEVVERPSNIVKELVENALDAGATKVTLILEEGGKSLISVIDNGVGMEPEDARISFLRHTTSKLTKFDDLQDVRTFGFRGEALASMCSVAQVTLTTRHQGQPAGLALTIAEGAILREIVTGCPVGTTVEVKNLFYNLPARQKFLKSTTTELNQITQLFKAFCVGRLDVHFVMIHNNTAIYNCSPVTTLQDRVAQLFDLQVSKLLLPLAHVHDAALTCEGVITGSGYGRYDRSGMYIFINQRWVKNYSIIQAIIKGYANVLPPGKYPLVVCNITVDPHEVDPNVHPKKEEIALLHPRIVESLVTNAVKKVLEQNVSVTLGFMRPLQKVPTYTSSTYTSDAVLTDRVQYLENQKEPSHQRVDLLQNNQRAQESKNFDQINYFDGAQLESASEKQEVPPIQLAAPFVHEIEQQSSLTSLVFLGQLHLTYLMFEHPDGLLLVDQHAAHERIIYERLGASFTGQDSVTLLFPELVNCTADDMEIVLQYLNALELYGIGCEQYSSNQLVVRSKSVYAQSVDVQELIHQILGWIQELGKADSIDIQKYVAEKMRAQIACKAAIKAGDPMSHEKVYALLKDLELVERRFSCPHGRPTMWVLPKYDIEKRFKRRL